MALFKIEKGLKANLAKNRPNTTEGFCYFTTDDGKFYIDTATATGTDNRVLLNAGAADKLTVNAGAANKPIYFKNGVPTEGSYELNKTVPSNAVFTDTNTKVTQTVTTSNAAYPLLLAPNGQTTTTTTTSYFDSGVTLNPSTNTIAANISGNAATATTLSSTLAIAKGGTGATTADAAANNLLSRGTKNGDFNTRFDTGHMWTQLPSCTNTPHGDNPTGRYGYLEVLGISSGIALQRWTNYINGDTWVRSSDAGSSDDATDWKEWSRYLDSNNYSLYALPLSGGTVTGTLTISNSNSTGGYVSLCEDGEGGTIRIGSKTGAYVWEMDAYNDTTFRIFSNGSGSYKIFSFNGSNGDLSATSFTGALKGNADTATNADKVDGYHATSFGINKNAGDVDLNTCTASGFYRLGGSITNNFTNAAWSQMLVVHGYGDTIKQIGMPYNENAIYIRGGNPSDVGGSGSWHDWKRLWGAGDSVTGAVWNDYAECRESSCEEPGYVLCEKGDDTLDKTSERLSAFAGVSSDTWGFSQGETEKAKTPIAVAGRVLVYTYRNRNEYKPGDCVCAAPGGTVDIMTREEVINWPDRIVGTVSCVPEYEEWGGGEEADRDSVKVNGRIWIKVK